MDHYYVAALPQSPCFFDCVFNLTRIHQQYYEPTHNCPKLGYCMEILMLLAKTLKFKYTLLLAENWLHLNQLVGTGAANFSLNLLTLREEDFSRYNFLTPLNYFRMGYGVHVASRTVSVESAYPFPPVAAFTAIVWYLILTSFISMTLLLLYIFGAHKNVKAAMNIGWYAIGLIFNEEIPEWRIKTLKRFRKMALLLATTPAMFSFLLLNYFYSDHIYGSLVAKTQKLDFNNTETLAAVVEAGKRKLLFYSDRAAFLETTLWKPPLPSYKKLSDALLKHPPKRFHSRQLGSIFLTGDKSDVLPATTMSFYTAFTDSSCSTEFVEEKELMASMESVIVNKKFTRYLQFHAVSTEVFPMVSTILKRYFVSNYAMCAEAKSDVAVRDLPSLNFSELKPLLYLLAGGSFVSACCFLAELWVFKRKK